MAKGANETGGQPHDEGERDVALATTHETVEKYRALARERPDVYLPVLVWSLKALATIFADLGRRDKASAATSEAEEIWRHAALGEQAFPFPDLSSPTTRHELGTASVPRNVGLADPPAEAYTFPMDTLDATRTLESKGFSREQAEALVEFMRTTIASELVTKKELQEFERRQSEKFVALGDKIDQLFGKLDEIKTELKADLAREIGGVRADLGKEIAAVRTDLGKEIAAVRADLTKEILAVRVEAAKEIAALRVELHNELSPLQIQLRVLEWMVGIMWLMVTALFIKTFGEPMLRTLGIGP